MASIFDPLEVHKRAMSKSRPQESSPPTTGSSSRDGQRSRALMEAHRRATTGPRRSSSSFTWTYFWPANTDPKYVNFHNEVH